ncbi:MAG: metal-sensing transcriptional repressor [Patescibacteria group bacterium]|jgi:DNA-binding FrmR family transcriptional regulator
MRETSNENCCDHKKRALLNFKKAQSHIGKIAKMIEDDNYCIDIMQQNLAVIGLLRSAHDYLMEGHLNTCFKRAIDSNNDKKKREMIEEILSVAKLHRK